MIRIIDKSLCCGCTACEAVCPHDAITMRPDMLGFLYPEADPEKCVGCGLCEKVCAFSKAKPVMSEYVKAYGARSIDPEVLMSSRSGGVFPQFAEMTLNDGGTVYGAGYEDGFRVVHKRASDISGVKEFRGSKYVQSDMRGIFRMVRKDLQDGYKVLFTGTPCQVDGLRSYLPERLHENLLSVDIVCHGVPSPYVWRDYLTYQQGIHGGKVTEVDFRNKREFGWKAHKETFTIGGSKHADSSYTYLFYEHVMFRDSCHRCPYACTSRPSDVTLADFWGWQNVLPDFNLDDRGVSLVLCSTEKGDAALKSCSQALEIRQVDVNECLQPNLRRPSSAGKSRERFIRDYTRKGLLHVMKEYGDLGWRYKVYITYMNIKYKVKSWLGR